MNKEAQIQEIVKDITGYGALVPIEVAKRLYELGYRKPPDELRGEIISKLAKMGTRIYDAGAGRRDNPINYGEEADQILAL